MIEAVYLLIPNAAAPVTTSVNLAVSTGAEFVTEIVIKPFESVV